MEEGKNIEHEAPAAAKKLPRCRKGTRRNRKTGDCERTGNKKPSRRRLLLVDVLPDSTQPPETRSIPTKKKKKRLRKQRTETVEDRDRRDIAHEEHEYPYLYPNLDDPLFNQKIAERQEFYDTRYIGNKGDIITESDKLCNAEFELAPHQLFVRNFMSFQTPYNSLLLFHGLGSGKTCSAISVAEEMRDYMKQMGISQRILVIASPNVQDNFKLQLFDEQKLELIDGLWNIRACTGNKYLNEINPMNMKGLARERVITQVKRIINAAYLFMGYIEFANYVEKKSLITSDIPTTKKKAFIRAKLRKQFGNRLIIIDEVHNIRMTDDNKEKKVAVELEKLIDNVPDLRLLFLSATPMYNSYKESIWLINLMNKNDGRDTIDVKDVFEGNGAFKIDNEGREVGKQLLMRKATGYISFVRGDNPYTFPYRVWPNEFASEHTFEHQERPMKQLNGSPIIQDLELVSTYLTEVGEIQGKGYNLIIDRLKSGDSGQCMPSFANMESFGYTLLQRPLEALNMVYPMESYDRADIDIKDIVGKAGLDRIMTYTESASPPQRFDFQYKEGLPHIFCPGEIEKYSGKIKNICDNIMNSTGVILVYSQYIDGGVVPIALALEELGFLRTGSGKSLFKRPPGDPLDIKTYKRERPKVGFAPARYVMITGDKALSPNNVVDLKAATDIDNRDGEKVKVILISQAGSEGLDFKFIRQVHVLEPWYNMNRIEQIIGRAVRTCSHKNLPFSKRNVEIYLHGSLMIDREEEAADLYVYRLAEVKAIQIGHVSRAFKEVAVDCILNSEQLGFTVGDMKLTVDQTLSTGQTIKYKVGDKPFSAMCDYMDKCTYSCKPVSAICEEDVKLDTYNESFIMMNTDKIIQHIRNLMKERYFYRKMDILRELMAKKSYPLIQIDAALTQLVEDKNEYITDRYERIGHLINIGDLYLFQPLELNNDHISVYDRSVPLEWKRDSLVVDVPEVVSESIVSDPRVKSKSAVSQQVQRTIDEMKAKYDIATNPQTIKRGEEDWYKFCSVAIDALVDQGISRTISSQFVIEHIIDELPYDATVQLLNDLELNRGESSSFEHKVYAYLTRDIMKSKGLEALLFSNMGSQQLLIRQETAGNHVWHPAEPEDYVDLKSKLREYVNRFIPIENKLSSIIGFMINFKKEFIVFKTRDLTKKRTLGARCDQAGKTASVKIMNHILGEKKYATSTPISKRQLCVMQEFTLRFYNKEKRHNKIWFLTPAEATITNIEKQTF